MSFASRVLAGLGRAFVERAGPVVEDLVDGLSAGAEPVDEWVELSPSGFPAVLDLATTTEPAFVGLATGTPVPAGLPLEAQRAYVAGRPRFKRGTPAALLAAVAAALNNDGTPAQLFERYGGPWLAELRIFRSLSAAELQKVTAAATSQKPVGIILEILPGAGATYQHFINHHGTYATVDALVGTYANMTSHQAEGGTTP